MKRITKFIFLAILTAVPFSCKDQLSEGALENYITVDPTEITATHEEKIVEITVDANCQWTLKKMNEDGTAADWFKVDKMTAKGATKFNVKVLANPTGDARTGTIDLVAENATAFITISQDANPNPGEPDEPDVPVEPVLPSYYSMPVYQMFENGGLLDVPSGAIKVIDEPTFTNCTIEGKTVKFNDGLIIEATGENAVIKMACPTHTNPKAMAGFQLGIEGSGFAAGDAWIYKIPMKTEISGNLMFTYGSRKEGISATDPYEWSSDEGKTWNSVDKLVSGVSEGAFKSIYFTIPADKKVEAEKYLWIKVKQTVAKVYIQTGIALDYADVAMTALPAQNATNVVISEGFDSTKDAHGAMVEVPGYLQTLTSGRTALSKGAGVDTGLLTLENTSLGFLHCSARPGFAQVGYTDPALYARAGWNGEVTMKVGDRLKEMGIAKTNLKITFKASGHMTAYNAPGDAKIIIRSGDTVVAKAEENLSLNSWTEYTLYVENADQSTVLVMTSELPADKPHSGATPEGNDVSKMADVTFFIDDLLVEATGSAEPEPEPKDPITLEFTFGDLPAGSWPTAAHSGGIYKFNLGGTDYDFDLSTNAFLAVGSAGDTYLRVNKTYTAGFPAIAGMKLVKIDFANLAKGASRQTVIVDAEGNEVTDQQVMAAVETYTFNIKNPEVGKVYYISAKYTSGNFLGFTKVTLYYE